MPLLGDDINWGTYFGMHYFAKGIYTYYDGRYLGDALVILITRFRPVAFIAYGGFMTLILYLVQSIKEQIKPSKSLGLLTASFVGIFILLMPKFIFQQILGWHSGFANYVPSVIFPLFMLLLVVKNYDDFDKKYRSVTIFAVFLFGIAAQFFAEHLTILNVFNDVLIILFLRKHFSKSSKSLFYFATLGNVIGAVLMFINGAYLKILTGSDSYRSIQGGGKKETIFRYLHQMFVPNKLLALIIILILFATIVIIYSAFIENHKQRIVNLSLLLSAFVVILPFIVVSPFGARCIFASYLFIAAIIAINFDIILGQFSKILLPISLLAFLVLGVRFTTIANSYRKTYDMQIEYTEYQNKVDRNVTYFLKYQNFDWIWMPGKVDSNFKTRYMKFPDRNLVIVKYQDWQVILNEIKQKKYDSDQKLLQSFDNRIVQKMN